MGMTKEEFRNRMLIMQRWRKIREARKSDVNMHMYEFARSERIDKYMRRTGGTK